MKKTFTVILVPTEKAQPNQLIYQQIRDPYGSVIAKPILEFTTNETYIRNAVLMNAGKAVTNSQSRDQFFELFIISNGEIKEGDPVLDKRNNGIIWKADKIDLSFLNANKKWFDVIIASSDKSITPHSWISESFVKAYVKAFGDGVQISQVDLEIGDDPNLHGYPEFGGGHIKTRGDGSVVIHPSKTYSRSQVEKMLHDYREYAWKNGVAKNDLDKWISANL